eukprot:UN19075
MSGEPSLHITGFQTEPTLKSPVLLVWPRVEMAASARLPRRR